MKKKLSSLNMEKGCLYETIITTEDKEGIRNSAPFGVICKKPDEIMLKMFKGTRTLTNILETKKFIVNITDNALLITKSFFYNVDNDELTKNNTLKDCDAYFKCEVIKEKEATRNDYIDTSDLMIIIAKVNEVVINKKSVKAINRAIPAVLDCLVNYSRIHMVDEDTKKVFLKEMKINKKLIQKVGSQKEKESIKLIEKELNKKGFEL